MRATLETLKPARDRGGSHPGLLLQCYVFHPADGSQQWSDEKHAVLQAAIEATLHEELRAIYRIAFDRWSAALPSDTPPVDLATAGRLIVGLGSENVLETGLRLHHTYGMPILPGSALKGLAAHYCDQVWGERDVETPPAEACRFRGGRREDRQRDQKAEAAGDYHRLLFGTTDDSGCIIFHDAWYVPDSSPQPLVRDVMTPHHSEWLDGSSAPTDFDSPTPVPFLSVTGAFRVAVSWHGPASDKAKNWTELARSLLCDALKDWGIGGKTTSGYGRMVDRKDVRLAKTAASATESVEQPQAAPRTVPKSPRREQHRDQVAVKVLERRDVGGRVQFFVQEEGKPRGVLAYGVPPPADKLPQAGDEITVYRNNQDPRSPQYRWDKPTTMQDQREGGRGGRRPHGRR